MGSTRPLVSIIVITYNSAKYVLETLESSKAQTYKNIELIISDDCSTDNTVEICMNWLQQNKEHFVRSEMIIVEQNTGIPANCNRGVKATKGEWIKLIAGDDILVDECILLNINHVNETKTKFVVSDLSYFDNSGELEFTTYNEIHKFLAKPYEKQKLHYLKYPLFLNSPTFFYSKRTLEKIDFFDENYFYIEDVPLIYKIYRKNIEISFMNHKTVLYRKHNENMTNKKIKTRLYLKKDLFKIYKDYRKPNLRYNFLCKYLNELDFFLTLTNRTDNYLYFLFQKLYNKYKFSL